MKKTTTLFICALMIAGCGPEDTTPTPEPVTCQKPRGPYMLYGAMTQMPLDPTCPQPGIGGDLSTAIPFKFDATGKLASLYEVLGLGTTCTTTYSNNDCSVKATCFTTVADGDIREEHNYDLSTDGLVLRGRYIMTGTGAYCPRMVVEGVGQYTAW